MPYKDKSKLYEAQKRYRQRKREEKEKSKRELLKFYSLPEIQTKFPSLHGFLFGKPQTKRKRG